MVGGLSGKELHNLFPSLM